MRIVLLAGGGALHRAGGALALLAGRRPRPARRRGRPRGCLYAVPVVERGPGSPVPRRRRLRAAARRVPVGRPAAPPRGAGRRRAGCSPPRSLGAARGARASTRASRGWTTSRSPSPSRADRRRASRGTTATTPLDWPRDGREVLRVTRAGASYWKAADARGVRRASAGARPRTSPGATTTRHRGLTATPTGRQRLAVDGQGPAQPPVRRRPGRRTPSPTSARASSGRHARDVRDRPTPLRRGDTYDAPVYVPRPSDDRADATPGPTTRDFALPPARVVRPARPRAGRRRDRRSSSPPWGERRAAFASQRLSAPAASTAERSLRELALRAASYELAQRIKGASTDPYDFVRRSAPACQRGAPTPRRRRPRARYRRSTRSCSATAPGYCQHFSGAMALLLRMGGVPARVAAGFSPGTLDAKRDEYVVRDLDAHSWVEVYFPRHRLGHVRPDPGRLARALARQTRHALGRSRDAAPTCPTAPARRPPARTRRRRGHRRRRATDGAPPWLPALGGPAGARRRARGWAAVVSLRRRRRAPGSARTRRARRAAPRAARGSGARPTPPTDAARARDACSARRDGARGYVRRAARRALRHGGAGARRRAERRALRRALGAGLGMPRPPAGLVGAARRSPRELRARSRPPPVPVLHWLAPWTSEDVYELFAQRHAACSRRATSTPPTVPLARARELEPDKDSVREAYGRALFGAQRYREAAEEFGAVVEHAPTNHYALFCLGRALQQLGKHDEALHAADAGRQLLAPAARGLQRSTATRLAGKRAPRVGSARARGRRRPARRAKRSSSRAASDAAAAGSVGLHPAPRRAAACAKRTSGLEAVAVQQRVRVEHARGRATSACTRSRPPVAARRPTCSGQPPTSSNDRPHSPSATSRARAHPTSRKERASQRATRSLPARCHRCYVSPHNFRCRPFTAASSTGSGRSPASFVSRGGER